MKISELARRTGVSVHRLRRYEDAGLIRAERLPSGYREFHERTVREVVFLSMGRDLGFSLQELADTLPRYRAGTLTFEQMVEFMQGRIAEVDALIAEQRALRKKLVSHIDWLKKRQREHDKARPPGTRAAWPGTRKEKR
jgi:MerR family copper efflux transcriptional regulator